MSGAMNWLTKAINQAKDNEAQQGKWADLGKAYFVRGLTNQYLYDFNSSIFDFDSAASLLPEIPEETKTGADEGAGGAVPPQLIASDAINARGYSKMQKALYGGGVGGEELISLLSESIADISTAINKSPEVQGMYYHNRGYSRYHRSKYLSTEEAKKEELLLAIADYEFAIGSGNFGTTAEAHAMKAQALALLGKLDEAQGEAKQASELDSKVFLVDLTNTEQLETPWPLPTEKFRDQNDFHSFQETSFRTFHYCGHCSKLIKPGKGHHCYKCDVRMHNYCLPKVKGKDCWQSIKVNNPEENPRFEDGVLQIQKSDHTHHLKATRFHKPTWCDLCLAFVASPVGKQGFQCIDCNMKLHKDCLHLVGNHFIED